MSNDKPPSGAKKRRRVALVAMTLSLSVVVAFGVTALLMNIFQRKQEAKNPHLRLVEVTDETTDSAPWGMNWARQYDGYRRTADVSRTPIRRLGGDAGRTEHTGSMAQARCSPAPRSRST